MGFIRYGEPAPSDTPELVAARLLAKASKRYKKQVDGEEPQIRIRHWPKALAALLKQYGEANVMATLSWYHDHITDEYMPVARDAKEFKAKYLRIKAKMNEAGVGLEITPAAMQMASTLKDTNSWSNGLDQLLPLICQRSIDAYTPWMHKWWKVLPAKLKDKPKEQNLYNHLRAEFGGPSNYLLNVWFPDIIDHTGPNGLNPHRLVFSPETERFNRIGRSMAFGYCNDSSRWDKLMEVMNSD